jgi:glycolate oxidase FAD binding subunit
VDYPQRDMTITVEAGLPIVELQRVLGTQGQRLPIDIPQAERATIGGAIATNACGPGRFGYGTFRDYVIGISAVDGQGRLFSAGGRVVKNVAGYDLCKLLIGSAGALAIITQVTLKVRPIVPSRRLAAVDFANLAQLGQALEVLNTSATRPVLLDALNAAGMLLLDASSSSRWRLYVGYEGSERETSWQLETVQRELQGHSANLQLLTVEESDVTWKRLTEFPVLAERLAVQGSAVPSAWSQLPESLASEHPLRLHAGNGVGTWLLPGDAQQAVPPVLKEMRMFCEGRDGGALVLNPPAQWSILDRCGTLPASWRLVQQIKATLDPAGLLVPGWWGPEAAAVSNGTVPL